MLIADSRDCFEGLWHLFHVFLFIRFFPFFVALDYFVDYFQLVRLAFGAEEGPDRGEFFDLVAAPDNLLLQGWVHRLCDIFAQGGHTFGRFFEDPTFEDFVLACRSVIDTFTDHNLLHFIVDPHERLAIIFYLEEFTCLVVEGIFNFTYLLLFFFFNLLNFGRYFLFN